MKKILIIIYSVVVSTWLGVFSLLPQIALADSCPSGQTCQPAPASATTSDSRCTTSGYSCQAPAVTATCDTGFSCQSCTTPGVSCTSQDARCQANYTCVKNTDLVTKTCPVGQTCQPCEAGSSCNDDRCGPNTICKAAPKAVTTPSQDVQFPPAGLGTTVDPSTLIGNVIKGILGIIGTLALGLFIYGGIELMISRGDSSKIKKGYDTMIYAAVGLAVIFGSYAVTSYIITRISK